MILENFIPNPAPALVFPSTGKRTFSFSILADLVECVVEKVRYCAADLVSLELGAKADHAELL